MMNEGLRPKDIEYIEDYTSVPHESAVYAIKAEILEQLIANHHLMNSSQADDVRVVTLLELLASTESSNHPAVHVALDQLQAAGLIKTENYMPNSNTNTVFPSYSLTNKFFTA